MCLRSTEYSECQSKNLLPPGIHIFFKRVFCVLIFCSLYLSYGTVANPVVLFLERHFFDSVVALKLI